MNYSGLKVRAIPCRSLPDPCLSFTMFTISWYFIGLSRFYIICSPACLVFCISSRAAVQLLQWLQWQWPCTPGHWTLGSRKNSVRLIIVSVYSGAAAAAAAPPHWPHSVIITLFNYFLLTAGCWCRGQDTRLLQEIAGPVSPSWRGTDPRLQLSIPAPIHIIHSWGDV